MKYIVMAVMMSCVCMSRAMDDQKEEHHSLLSVASISGMSQSEIDPSHEYASGVSLGLMEEGGLAAGVGPDSEGGSYYVGTSLYTKVEELEKRTDKLEFNLDVEKKVNSLQQTSYNGMARDMGILKGSTAVNLCANQTITCATCTLGLSIVILFSYIIAKGNIVLDA